MLLDNYKFTINLYLTDVIKDVERRVCTIISTSLPSLTASSERIITKGTQNVILYCVCRINNTDNVTVGPAFWFFDGALVTLTENDGSGNPYLRDNVPSPLIIPSFDYPRDGNYSCGPTTIFDVVSTQGDTITLTLDLPGIYVYLCYLFL